MLGKRKVFAVLLLVPLLTIMVLTGCGQDGIVGGDGENGQSQTVGVEWEHVTDEDGALLGYGGEDVYITDVCAGGPGVVAVGYRVKAENTSAASPPTLEIWASEDGKAWSRLGPDAFIDGASPLIEDEYSREEWSEPCITSGQPGLVITTGLHIFISGDGLSWREIRGVAAFEGSQCEMNSATGRFSFTYKAGAFQDVAGIPGGYVASVIADNTRQGMQGWLPGPSIWASPDAENWSLVQAEYIELFGMDAVNSITVGGPGLVAVGSGVEEDYDANGAGARVWTGTADGNSWSRLPDDPSVLGGPGDQEMKDVVPGGPGLVAAGYGSADISGGQEYTGLAWTSPDGIIWKRSAPGEAVFADAELFGVAAGGPGIVVAGAVHNQNMISGSLASESLGAAVWTSTGGLSWSRILLPYEGEDAGLNASAARVASFSGGLVVVGSIDYPGSDTTGAIWVSLSE